MAKLTLISLILLVVLCSSIFGQSDEFAMGNKFYEDKDYASAIRMYQSVLDQKQESAGLYFNLGNAYFKSGDLGLAILNYMRAQRLAPGDEDIQANLEFATQFPQVQMEGVELNPVRAFLLSIVAPYHMDELAWASSGLFVLLMLLLIVRFGLLLAHPAVRTGIITIVTLLVITASLTTFKYHNEYLTRRGVIIAEEAPVYTGASEHSEIELHGASGLVVEILEEDSDFISVSFANKRRGWMHRDLVAEL